MRALPREVDITAWILAERAVRYHLLNDDTRAEDPFTEKQGVTDTIGSKLPRIAAAEAHAKVNG